MATAMTYLDLCRALARESGTVSSFSSQPASVLSQTGRNRRIVEWVKHAWIDIQNMHESWRFRRAEFSGKSLITSTDTYTFASFTIDNGYRWIESREQNDIYTIYDSAVGAGDEGALTFIPYEGWKRRYGRGAQTDERPSTYSIDYDGNLRIGPAPDKAYVFSGEYIRSAQEFTANADEPLCPAEFHMGIVWRALVYLTQFDEAPLEVVAAAEAKWMTHYRAMANKQLPPMTMAGSSLA